MRRWKKGLILLAVAVVLAVILEVIQVAASPAVKVYVPSEEMRAAETAIYPGNEFDSAYATTENGLVPQRSDPWMQIETGGAGVFRCVSFTFSRPTKGKTDIQIYYPAEGKYDEEHSVFSRCPENEEYWAMEIPEGAYPAIRVDMDGTAIPLKSIAVGQELPEERISKPAMKPGRIVKVAAVLLVIMGLLWWMKAGERLRRTVEGAIRGIREDRRKSLLNAAIFPAAVGGALLLMWLAMKLSDGQMTAPKIVFACIAGLCIACVIVFRKTMRTQPEYLFAALVLGIGFLFCYYVPHTGLNSWDEDSHYLAALQTSYVDEVRVTPQDELTIARSREGSFDLTNGGVDREREDQDRLNAESATAYSASLSEWMIPEAFNGLGLYIGRALGLRYYLIHFLGRFTGLMAYAVTGFFAIRRLKSGKMAAAAVMLIPTALFLASSYNYDSYLTVFTALGLCYYMGEWQRPEEKLTLQHTVIMIGAFFFGCLTKAVYLPLMWILFFLPKEKFRSPKERKYYFAAIIGATVLMGLLLMLRVESVSWSDTRGGANVDGKGQIVYILKHPAEFCGVMLRYLWDEYLNLSKAGELLTNMAYHGYGPYPYVYLVLLFTVMFTDKNEHDRALVHRRWSHAGPLLLALFTTGAVMASMYIAFTPVGHGRINGAQFRYLIPILLPVMMHASSGLIENRMDRGWYNTLALCTAGFVGFAAVYEGFIAKYI